MRVLKTNFIYLVCVFLHITVSGQELVVDLVVKAHCIHIGRAEMSIVDGNYAEAIRHYHSAKDLRPLYNYSFLNLITCHIRLGEVSKAVDRAIELCDQGYPVTMFKRKQFDILNTSDKWRTYVLENAGRIYYKEGNRISKLVEIDQYIRHNDLERDTAVSIQLALIDSTEKIIREIGFNSVSIEGYKVRDDTLIYGDHLTILAVHALRIKGDEFKSLILECLSSGKISPYNFAFYTKYFDHETNDIFIGCNNFLDAVFYQVENIIYTCDDELRERSNKVRAELGLLPVEDVIRLFEYYYREGKDFSFHNLANLYARLGASPDITKEHNKALENGIIYKILDPEDVDYFK